MKDLDIADAGKDKNNTDQDCEKIQKLLVFYQAKELSEDQTYRVNEHLLFCPECLCHIA